jgi:hypothetical protein
MLFDFDCTFLSFTDQLASFSFFYYWFWQLVFQLEIAFNYLPIARHLFDEQRVPNLAGDPAVLHDIHSVSSVLKLYFRDLPTPLGRYFLTVLQGPAYTPG